MNIFSTKIQKNRGMTYVEIIVVLSIFSIISSITLFNYRRFQEKVDVKTLVNDMALKIVETQKDSLSGKMYAGKTPTVNPWKPSYGVSFDMATPKGFFQFADLDQGKTFSDSILCHGSECLNRITITKSSSISSLLAYYSNGTSTSLADLNISFTRPDSSATFRSNTAFTGSVSYVQITLLSPMGVSSSIKVYPSGRVQIN